MNALKDSQTFQNLVNSWVGESQAHIRYKFIVYACNQKKLYELGKAIKVITTNEFNHARMFYTKIQSAAGKQTFDNLPVTGEYPLKEKWDFLKNFEFAIENETSESKEIYKSYAKTARDEGFEDIAQLFDYIAKIENCHKLMFTELHDQLKNDTMYKRDKAIKWKCADCGHEDTLTEAWEICPVCGAVQGAVMLNLKSK